MSRDWNFSAGPAVLPESMLSELREVLLEFGETRAGLMEISHRSKPFEAVMESARERLKRVLGAPDDTTVLYLQGGASMQFYQSALNLTGPDDTIALLDTGTWAAKAAVEARRICHVEVPFSGKTDNYTWLPVANGEAPAVSDKAVYLHYTSNNTVCGTQWHQLPDTDLPLVADLSSDICSRPIDVARHALIYAGAQKNLGPSGVTAVMLAPWALERARTAGNSRPGGLPSMMDYGVHAAKNSAFNTPNTFGIFALDLMLRWVEDQGGVTHFRAKADRMSSALYEAIERTGFYRSPIRPDSRSTMNVVWRIHDPELEPVFVKEADAAGLLALKGHRSVGGIRASMYNALPEAAVHALVDFMGDFERRNG
jgi:phosphoserine aminotransferase